jgi:hypothetical protein
MMITLSWKAGDVNGVLFSKQTYPWVFMELSSRTTVQFYTFYLHAIVDNEIGLLTEKLSLHTEFDQFHLPTDQLIPVAHMFVARPRFVMRY